MPTGYTYPVVEGKITEFPDFALSCARAFGALITMRDEPMDAPIPEEFKPRSYNETRLAESKSKLAELNAMSTEEVAAKCESAYVTALASHEKYEAGCVEEDRRLDAMLVKVRAWTPPTAGHTEMKTFMIDQLVMSKRGTFRPMPPARKTPAEWHEAEIKQAIKDVAYHAGEHAKEVERAQGRTEWIKALRSSLASPDSKGAT